MILFQYYIDALLPCCTVALLHCFIVAFKIYTLRCQLIKCQVDKSAQHLLTTKQKCFLESVSSIKRNFFLISAFFCKIKEKLSLHKISFFFCSWEVLWKTLTTFFFTNYMLAERRISDQIIAEKLLTIFLRWNLPRNSSFFCIFID
jgi:hypothetical protein